MSSDLPSLLLASLHSALRKLAEQSLTALTAQPGFISALLQLVLGQGTEERSVHLVIAALEFPERWPDLINRAHVCFDALFSEINYVLSRFVDPFLQLFHHTAGPLLSLSLSPHTSALVGQVTLLFEIYYHFTYQDRPPVIEDAHVKFWRPEQGWLVRVLGEKDGETGATSVPDTGVGDRRRRAERHAKKRFEANPLEFSGHGVADVLQALVRSVYKAEATEIAGTGLGGAPGPCAILSSYFAFYLLVLNLECALTTVLSTQLVLQSLRFISTPLRSGCDKDLSGSKETIEGKLHGAVVRNVSLRMHEMERFAASRLEFSGQGAADVLQALVGSGYEAVATGIA
ncbi:hypothetical protein FIBSPDRAFT_956631 [Athelia psychrophila]|uniref:Exportin-2 central domain-containing protein n=1 Tax=Athelia psychrophila TaxID=1759441 RepID=A0A166GQR4_9AGAM|nr:hypothetical protein FIBSPDRAFT_956631 [Fibularhizoctonia sp. CBS 109695]